MADIANKYTKNVSGQFYVDDQCIDCDLCRETAPDNFKRSDDGGYSFVFSQPTTPEEEALCEEAMEGCPVEAIGNLFLSVCRGADPQSAEPIQDRGVLQFGCLCEDGKHADISRPSACSEAMYWGDPITGPSIVRLLELPLVCQTASFSVTASGVAPLFYRWRKGGTSLTGKTNNSLIVVGASAADGGSYDVVVSNAFGVVTSDPVMLSFIGPPIITTQAPDQVVAWGQTIRLAVPHSGTPPFTYQWFKNHAQLPNANTQIYTITNAQTTDAGLYNVAIINSVGFVSSALIQVSIGAPPAVVFTNHLYSIRYGTNLVLTPMVTGDQPWQVRWTKNGGGVEEPHHDDNRKSCVRRTGRVASRAP